MNTRCGARRGWMTRTYESCSASYALSGMQRSVDDGLTSPGAAAPGPGGFLSSRHLHSQHCAALSSVGPLQRLDELVWVVPYDTAWVVPREGVIPLHGATAGAGVSEQVLGCKGHRYRLVVVTGGSVIEAERPWRRFPQPHRRELVDKFGVVGVDGEPVIADDPEELEQKENWD